MRNTRDEVVSNTGHEYEVYWTGPACFSVFEADGDWWGGKYVPITMRRVDWRQRPYSYQSFDSLDSAYSCDSFGGEPWTERRARLREGKRLREGGVWEICDATVLPMRRFAVNGYENAVATIVSIYEEHRSVSVARRLEEMP